jgi:hypothetical protein
MSYEQLKAAFMAFGQVKHLDVVHTKVRIFNNNFYYLI